MFNRLFSFIRRLVQLFHPLGSVVPILEAHDPLAAEVEIAAILFSRRLCIGLFVVDFGQAAGHQVGPLPAAHIPSGLDQPQVLFVHQDGSGLFVHIHMFSAVFIQPLGILVPAGSVVGMVAGHEDGAQEGFPVVAHLFHYPLPQGTAGSRVVSGFRGVGEAQLIRFLFHRQGHQLGTAQVGQQVGAHCFQHIALAAGHGCQKGNGEGTLHSVGRVVLLPVTQFMAQYKGQFVLVVVQGGEQAHVYGYIVAQGAVSIEFGAVVDKIMIGILFDGRISLGNGGGQPAHDPVQHGIGFRILIDPFLLLDLIQVFSPALAVQVGHLLVQHAVLGGHQDDGADGIAPVKGFRCRQGGQGQGCGQDQAGQGQGQLFLQVSGVQTDHGNSPLQR